ncbi:hypothetical protein [Chondromyces crocatus]|uniref:Uncharacterized protein n=1 Tax=Chondromyces crocatus TaxID=52 RepID=A0A0K1END5_CHOCO|nr:hypothetical protein [Chondromyces crocatus]AKT42356.1 uncharacterized protein CMC5_065820 [Chondromyces crocatus]
MSLTRRAPEAGASRDLSPTPLAVREKVLGRVERVRWALLLGTLGLLGGTPACSGSAPPATSTVSPVGAPVTSQTPTYTSPARWVYHPLLPVEPTAVLRLSDGKCVLTAEGGQRWLVTPRGTDRGAGASAASTCAGPATASPIPAVEDLVGVARGASSAWWFFGKSGAIYEASTPLGAFKRTLAPPAPLRKITGSSSGVLAVSEEGRLLRLVESEGGWKDIPLPSAPAASGTPTGAAPWAFDVAAGDDGQALALAVPEALFHSVDGGTTWARAPVSPKGLSRVGRLPEGSLLAEGMLRSVHWDPRRAEAFEVVKRELPARLHAAPEAGLPPSAMAVRMQRAALVGTRYVEVERSEDESAPWTFYSGSFEGGLAAVPIRGSETCSSLKLGAAGRTVVGICVKEEEDLVVADVLRSDDAGKTWSRATRLDTPHVDGIAVAVSPEGTVLITGVCKPGGGERPTEEAGQDADASASEASAAGDVACRPRGPLLLQMEGDRPVLSRAAAPALGGSAMLPAFSVDGRSAYFVGERVKDGHLALFVSHDGGETFAMRLLARDVAPQRAPTDPDAQETPPEDDEEDTGRGVGALQVVDESQLVPGEDGAVGMLLGRQGELQFVVTDEDGRVLSTQPLPDGATSIGIVGRRGLAGGSISSQERGGDSVPMVWESLDGGARWVDLPLSPAIVHDAGTSPLIACGVAGCLLGQSVTRVGWNGQAEPPLPSGPEPPREEAALKAPMVCEFPRGSAWTRVEQVVSRPRTMPGASEIMRGRAVWSVLTRSPSGAVGTVAALLPERAPAGASAPIGESKIVERSLFSPPPAGTRMGLAIRYQMEGYAAARMRLPGAPRSPLPIGMPLRDVEIAWENWMDGVSGRTRLPDVGPLELRDVVPAAGDAYEPELLSVSVRGLFMRPHADGAAAYFVEPAGRGKSHRFDYPSWPRSGTDRELQVSSDAAWVEGRPLAVGMVHLDSSAAITGLLLARQHAGVAASSGAGKAGASSASDDGVTSGGWAIEAFTIAPPPGEGGPLVQIDWSYAGGAIGVSTLLSHPIRRRGWASFQVFRSDGILGPAQALPTPWDLPAVPRPCSQTERAATPRIVAPMFARRDPLFPGTRHPIVVLDPSGLGGLPPSLTLLTSAVVLHGTPKEPCVAAWEASAVGTGEFTAVIPGDLAHAWLFRARDSRDSFEARPMACRFDPAVKLPQDVLGEPGTTQLGF